MTANIQQNGTNDGTQIGVNEGTVIIGGGGSALDPLDQACLQDLRITDPRDDKERLKSTSGGLLEASYQWIRDNEAFKQWQHDQSGSKPVLWIRGNPGKGKTMLLCGIIEDLAKSHENAAVSFFFCQATDSRINSAKSVLRGLIYLLVEQNRSLLRHVRARYDSARESLFKDVNAWHALVSIFTQILEDSALKSVYLGIDALDECGDGRDLLLDLIIETAKTNSKIKWIVSSRNEREITELFDHAAQVAPISLEMSEAFVSEAINAFIEHKVADLAQKKRYKPEVRRKVHRHLVLNTRGTFLWVSLVLKNLARTQSRHVNEKLKTFPPGLDALYHRMMDQVRKSDDADFCKQILGTILTVYRPVTLSELGSLLAGRMDSLDDIDTISEMIESCGSFLTVQEDTVTLVHQSAKDFLDQEVQTEVLPKGVENEHHAIFSQCLSALIKTLRRDMFGLRLPGTTKAQIRAPSPNPLASAEYACVYWVDHLDDCQSNEAYRLSLKNREMVDAFLRRKYLNWLEALSLLGKVSDGIGAMRKLENILEEEGESDHLAEQVRDATRFIQHSRAGIEISPLQAYCSSLIFSPLKSLTRVSHERLRDNWILNDPVMEKDWSASIHTLEHRNGSVDWVAWSPDGRKLAVGFEMDDTIHVWDPTKGQRISTLEGQNHGIRLHTPFNISISRSKAWSPDGTRLAITSRFKTVRIWNPATNHIVILLMVATDHTYSVSWSPDGSQLFSGSADGLIRIWDPTTGQNVSTLKGHGEVVTSIAWSPDGGRLASASYDGTIKIWDHTTYQEVLSLDEQDTAVSLIVWSPDGSQLAIGSFKSTLLVWDLATNQIVFTLKGEYLHWRHSGFFPVTWSPDGSYLAFCWSELEVQIWHRATNQNESTSMRSPGHIQSIAWSPDGSQLASGSFNRAVQIWDQPTKQIISTLEGHVDHVRSVAWSPDGTLLSSGSNDGTVRIWDPTIIHSPSSVDKHRDPIGAIKWSPDGSQLASSSEDRTVRIWDPATGQSIFTSAEHEGSVSAIAWSPDGTRLASGSYSGKIQICNMVTDQCVFTVDKISEPPRLMVWSPDGSKLASHTTGEEIQIYNSFSGQNMSTLKLSTKVRSSIVWSISWSPAGSQLASGVVMGVVRIWDLNTGECQFTLSGHDGAIVSIAWSENGTRLASGSEDNTIRIWNPATGHNLFTLPVGISTFLEFDKSDSNHLHTSAGIFDIGSMPLATDLMTENLIDTLQPSGYGLSNDRSWITYNGLNLLWLPLEYRPLRQSHFAIYGATVAIACSSGYVIFLELSKEFSGTFERNFCIWPLIEFIP